MGLLRHENLRNTYLMRSAVYSAQTGIVKEVEVNNFLSHIRYQILSDFLGDVRGLLTAGLSQYFSSLR